MVLNAELTRYIFCISFLIILSCDVSYSAGVSFCGKCYCVSQEVTCDIQNAKITGPSDLTQLIPKNGDITNIGLDPNSFESVYVNCRKSDYFKDQILTKEVLSIFRNVRKLTLINCDVVEIHSNAFQGLYKLEDINFAVNRIRAVPKGLFVGLGNFKSVNFQENSFVHITEDSFVDLSTEKLFLTKCSLSEFPLDALTKIKGLTMLKMSENNIQFIDSKAKSFISSLQFFFLDQNPISCTCPNRWLTEINWQEKSPEFKKLTSNLVPVCKHPYYLMDIDLTKLKPDHFQCNSPKIDSIDLKLTENSLIIKCNPEIKDNIKWTLVRNPPTFNPPGQHSFFPVMSEGYSFQHIISKSTRSMEESYRLTASTSGGSSNLTFTVRWSSKQIVSTPTVIPKREGDVISKVDLADKPGANEAHTDYFSKKQFTLLEMIFAVIGTFMGTLLIFILVCQFVTWYKKRDKKRWATYVHQPYNGYGYNCNTLHAPPSHHEYDVPQITQPCLPQSPPVNEFFDYKTQRMLYNNHS